LAGSDARLLRRLAVMLGLAWSALFVLIGIVFRLQLYGDGSIFSYSIAVQAGWGYHFHNIADRMFVYAFSHLPAEAYVALTRDARGGIFLYGLLFFAAPLVGLLVTFAADRSPNRTIFCFACLSTACLCPLVFGFPTEMWIAHSLFWPALAVCHYARPGILGTAVVFAVLLALVFTHEGALIFAVAILATLLLRRGRDATFLRAAGALVTIILLWIIVRAAFPPDDYVGDALRRAAWHVFDPSILTGNLVLLLFGALASYAIAFLLLRRLAPTEAPIYAGAIVVVMLVAYWMWFDHTLHSENRYYLRTMVLVATPMLGVLAAVRALDAEGRLRIPLPSRPMELFISDGAARGAASAVVLVLLVHAVETAKFIRAWTDYKGAVVSLAMSATSDPALGDPRFVSSERINPALNRLGWSSTTHFLSVLVAPGLAPRRLVVDPNASYFWLSCAAATANRDADRALPSGSRELVRVYACLHR
jgi:hypothetical protein